ncbi:MAG: hypothetical protein MUC49_02900 [Raineya sp.]|nr:hypothetical protein [Raineya sp.]
MKKSTFEEKDILQELDLAFEEKPSSYFPIGKDNDIRYNIFPDLEHGYFATANSKIHLYANSEKWAIVFEKSGYQNRGTSAEIELNYFGNCINYIIEKYQERSYITNTQRIIIIEPSEFKKIENKEGKGIEKFELIDEKIKEIKVRNKYVTFDNNSKNYEKLGIQIRDYQNPKRLIAFEAFVRYLSETKPEIVSATEEEIRQHIPKNIPKLMTIDEFYFISRHNETILPSNQELYKLLAKILTIKDTSQWKPTLKPNNHWSNWKSGSL